MFSKFIALTFYFLLVIFVLPISIAAETVASFSSGKVNIEQTETQIEVTVTSQDDVEAESLFVPDPSRLVIDLWGVGALEAVKRPATADMVKLIRSGQHSDKVRLVFDLSESVEFSMLHSSRKSSNNHVFNLKFPSSELSQEKLSPVEEKHKTVVAEQTVKNTTPVAELEISHPLARKAAETPTAISRLIPVSGQYKLKLALPEPAVKVIETAASTNNSLDSDSAQSIEAFTVSESDSVSRVPIDRSTAASGRSRTGSESESDVGDDLKEVTELSRLAERDDFDKAIADELVEGDDSDMIVAPPYDPAEAAQLLFAEEQGGDVLSDLDIAIFLLIGFLLFLLVFLRPKKMTPLRNEVFADATDTSAEINPYDVLGCPQDASDNDIKSRYKHLMKVYHRDSMESKDVPEEVRRLSEQQLQLVKEAYDNVRTQRGF